MGTFQEFRNHKDFQGSHSILSASKPHWLNYDDERMFEYVSNLEAARRGTELHAFAAEAIRLGIKLPNTSQTLNMYVNDAIGFRMKPEQVLFYSKWAYGTADAIAFDKFENILRIHDLKNGRTKVSETQLEVYAAYFCLEYDQRPSDVNFELRIYQNDEVIPFDTDPLDIVYIMSRIVELDKLITEMMEEV